MNSEQETKTGGASIKPTARPSIHSHRGGCLFSLGERVDMVSYGLPDTKANEEARANLQTTITDEGKDEVDNVLSKFHRAPSPLAAKRITHKRNSIDEGATYTDDSDNSSKLAKSLPVHFESLLSNSSDEYGNWPSSKLLNRSAESSQSNRNRYENDSSFASNYESIQNLTQNQSTRQDTKSQQPVVFVMVFLITAVVAVLVAVYNGNLATSIPDVFTIKNTYNTAQFYNDLYNLGGKYKITDNTILQLQTGISTIFKREDTGSFVLAYTSNDRDFDHDKFNNLVNTIAATASKYLRNDSTSVKHIVVDGSKLEMRSHSELISKYRDDVTKTGVMLVKEMDKVPSSLAMAFHYYCDEYNPLVKRSAIFFTLDMAKCSDNPAEQYPTHAQIEKCLTKKWNGVPKDNISPLLNRVVSTVVNIVGN